MKLVRIVVANFLVLAPASADVLCKIDLAEKYVLAGLEFNSKSFVPTPYIGVWADFYYDPTNFPTRGLISRSYEFIASEKPGEYYMKVVISGGISSATLTSKRMISDWSLGYTDDEAHRKDIVQGKYLLDYDKPLAPLPSGLLPAGLVIQKYWVASHEDGDLYFVVYQSDSLDKIKAYHRIPSFVSAGYGGDYWYTSL